MSINKGQYYTLKYSGVSLGKLTNISLNMDGKQINISNFDSGEFEEYLIGRKNATIDFTCKRDDSDTTGLGNLIDDFMASNQDTILFAPKTPVTGDVSYSGSGGLANCKITADDDEEAEVTGTLQINGTLTKSTT